MISAPLNDARIIEFPEIWSNTDFCSSGKFFFINSFNDKKGTMILTLGEVVFFLTIEAKFNKSLLMTVTNSESGLLNPECAIVCTSSENASDSKNGKIILISNLCSLYC